jgi:hypothetical protein
MGRNELKRRKSDKPRARIIAIWIAVALAALAYRFVKMPPPSSAIGANPSPGGSAASGSTDQNLPEVAIDWPRTLQRDLFDATDLLPKGMPALEPVARPNDSEISQAVLAKAKQAIRLQGVISGPTPMALINGRSFGVNDLVEGFIVVGIEHNQVVLERDGVRVAVGNP